MPTLCANAHLILGAVLQEPLDTTARKLCRNQVRTALLPNRAKSHDDAPDDAFYRDGEIAIGSS